MTLLAPERMIFPHLAGTHPSFLIPGSFLDNGPGNSSQQMTFGLSHEWQAGLAIAGSALFLLMAFLGTRSFVKNYGDAPDPWPKSR